MTGRQVRDAISNYGKTAQMSQDEVSKALRELKAQALKVSAIEDVMNKLAPLKTGLQRDETSQEVRALTKKLHQMMKEAGISRRDPEKQLKSAMDAIKTRLSNQIDDLDKAILTGTKLVTVTPGVQYDTEANSLKAQRDALKSVYDEMFPKEPMTDAQRLQVAVKATQRSLDAWEAKVKAAERGEFPGKEKGPALPKNDALDAMRANRDALRAEFDRLDDLAHPGMSPEERALKNYKKALERSTARYQDKILRGDFAAKGKAERPLDEEGHQLKQANDKVRERYTALLRKYKLDHAQWTTRLMKRTVTPVFDFSREIKSAFDLSAVGRQGWFLAVSHPVIAANAMAKMFSAIGSEHKAYLVDESIKARPNYEDYLRAKLYLAPLETAANVNEHEEMYRSSWAKRIPGVRMSERTFVTFLNLLRADAFDVLTQSGFSGRAPTPEEQRIIASYINIATGRGDFGKFAPATELLATALWSPRLQLSRLQLLAGQPIYHGTAATRKLIGMEYAKSAAGIAMAIMLGMLMAPDDEESPDKWDIFATAFGKIKVGDTRVDLTAGLSSYIVAIARVVMGRKTTNTGRHVKLRGEGAAFGASTLGEVGSLARKKASPLVGVIANVLSGSNVIGEKVTPWSTFKDVFFPLSPVEVAQTIKAHDIPTGALLASLSIMGIGAQTYPSDSYADAKVDFAEAKHALKEAKTASERTAIRREYPYVGNGKINDIEQLNTEIHALTKGIKDRTAQHGEAAKERNARDQARIDAKKAKVVSLVTGK